MIKNRSELLGLAIEEQERTTTEERKNKREIFFGNIAISYPDCGRAYIITCICQNS